MTTPLQRPFHEGRFAAFNLKEYLIMPKLKFFTCKVRESRRKYYTLMLFLRKAERSTLSVTISRRY